MRLIDADNLTALLGDERATLHKEQQTFRAMSEIEFNARDYMLLHFQYIIDNAPTVIPEDFMNPYEEGYERARKDFERPSEKEEEKNDLRFLNLIDADALKELIQKDIDCGDNVLDSGYLNAMNLVTEFIDGLPLLDVEKTLKGEYQNGYWSGYNDAMERVRKEKKNERDLHG